MENAGVLLNQLLVELSLCGNFIIAADMDMFVVGVHLAVNLTKMTANFQRAPFRKTGFVWVPMCDILTWECLRVTQLLPNK